MTAATILARIFCLYVIGFVLWLLWCTARAKVREMSEERADADAREAAEQAEWLATMRDPSEDRAAVEKAYAQWSRGATR